MAQNGFAPIPIHGVSDDGSCRCGNPNCASKNRGKHPFGNGWQNQPIDAAWLDAAWLPRGGNLGWRMGEQPCGKRLVALDEDEPGAIARAEAELGALPLTLTSRSGSGIGGHRVFEWPADKPLPKGRVKALPGIDVRSQGGQIVVEPSRHHSGGSYAWLENGAQGIATLPPAWCDALLADPKRKTRATNDDERSGVHGRPMTFTEALRPRVERCPPGVAPEAHAVKVCNDLEPATQGDDGHGRLLALARALVWGLALEPTTAAETAWAHFNPRCMPPWEEHERADFDRKFSEAAKPFGDLARGYLLPPTAAVPTFTGGEDRSMIIGNNPGVDAAIRMLATPELGVFQRSGKLVAITREARDDGKLIRPRGTPTIRELPAARVSEMVGALGGDRKLVPAVMARGEWDDIRPLDAIVSYPVMRRDGTLLTRSGYDSATRTLAEMAIDLDVPDAPTRVDAIVARSLLTELVGDFPFANGGRSAWLAALLTPLARPAIDGPTPLLLLDASQRGSGKTLLADALSTIVTGEVASRRVAPKTREEWDKVLFSILLAGDPLVLFDNVTNMLVSDALDAVLTGTVFAQRVLGVNEDRRVAVRTMFIASANNARLSTDLVRRSLGCRLEPADENPEMRTTFREPDLLGHVRRERHRYLAAALTILRAYAVADRPRVTARPMGSYTAWCRVVRDALVWAGAEDPATTQDALRESADVERDELGDLLSAWHATLGDRAVTARELLDAARAGTDAGRLLDALRGAMPSGAEPSAHGIGNALRKVRGQIVGGLVLRESAGLTGANARKWCIRSVR
jgi:hypothetical protein